MKALKLLFLALTFNIHSDCHSIHSIIYTLDFLLECLQSQITSPIIFQIKLHYSLNRHTTCFLLQTSKKKKSLNNI